MKIENCKLKNEHEQLKVCKKEPPEKMMRTAVQIDSNALLTSLFRHFLFFKKSSSWDQRDQGQGTGTRDKGQIPLFLFLGKSDT